jgi:hypothetical protein
MLLSLPSTVTQACQLEVKSLLFQYSGWLGILESLSESFDCEREKCVFQAGKLKVIAPGLLDLSTFKFSIPLNISRYADINQFAGAHKYSGQSCRC